MASRSAGILLYRRAERGLEVLLVHPGGPFWAKKDAGVWSVPKGQIEPGETPQATALREFAEETGCALQAKLLPLGDIVQAGGKKVTAFACEGDFDVTRLASNLFEFVWSPRSGQTSSFPEVDRAGWFDLAAARAKILAS